jgi:hypothetical protein
MFDDLKDRMAEMDFDANPFMRYLNRHFNAILIFIVGFLLGLLVMLI